MSSQLNDDLGRVLAGELDRDEFRRIHGDHDVEAVLSLHDRLSNLSTIDVEVAPWYAVAPRLGTDPTSKWVRGKKAVLVSIDAALVLVPAAAEAIEAVAPDAVRGTVIDRITDVLPWDNDRARVDDPAPQPIEPSPVDRAPVEEEPIEVRPSDQTMRTIPTDSTTEPARRETDSTDFIEPAPTRDADGAERNSDRVPATTDEPTHVDEDSRRIEADSVTTATITGARDEPERDNRVADK